MAKYSSYILYLLIAILVAILYVNDFGPAAFVQRSLDDALCRLTAPEGKRPNLAIVMIDGRAQDEHGSWPWNYDLIADLAAATATGEPRAVVFDFPLPEDAYQDSAGYTDVLAGQLSWIQNAVLPYDLAMASYRSGRTSNPPELFYNSIATANPLGIMSEEASLQVRRVFLPASKLLAHKPHLGFDLYSPDNDRALRRQPMVMNYDGYYYPAQSLLAAAVYLGVPPDQIRVDEGSKISIGSQRSFHIGGTSEYFIRFSAGKPFVQYSAAEVLQPGFDLNKLKDKLVLIGVDDPRNSEFFRTPVGESYPALWVKASIMENIINRNYVTPASGIALLDLLVLFILGGVCAFFLPRVSLMFRFVILGGALFVVVNISYFLVSSFGILPQTVFVALELLLFMGASPLLDAEFITGEAKTTSAPSKKKLPKAKTSKESPAAPPAVRELKASATDSENIKTSALGLDEGEAIPAASDHTEALKADATEAVSADELSAGTTPGASERPSSGTEDYGAINLDEPADETVTGEPVETPEVPEPIAAMDATPIPGGASELHNLGRYQVTGVLGKGAMGTVYQGVDPAINRPVALKTIRLDFVNDPEEMAELKERLFREAQAAGKLSHPNIVTIYDVGSEEHLQYIAMEYLEGQTLEDLIKRKAKFNYRIIAQIITQICSALEYAHNQGIVHRDIKPANIMVLKDYSVKVMDYGIARIDSNSMTKTGIAMGTPNYISPEQLRGQSIDRRADIFSLGVVIYEMLLGKRPFKGENITSLIYSILNHEPEKPSNVNPRIPLLFDHIVAKALMKEPPERYQKASEIVVDLQDFVESFASR
ncbi:MAG: protein kinase [Candidatus Zixiibacteriota bacterium]|nr:MAG: protein kinase [candidate division Zixibacteria bacterium]